MHSSFADDPTAAKSIYRLNCNYYSIIYINVIQWEYKEEKEWTEDEMIRLDRRQGGSL